MCEVFTLKQLANMRSEFILNSGKANELGLVKKKQAYVSFGSRKRYVEVKVSDTLAKDNIQLSKNIMEDLLLPDYITYEIRVKKNEIILGPFIGLLFRNCDEALSETYLKKILLYARDYPRINGAIVVFALDKVDSGKQMIEGYCYNPSSGCWQRGVFPYPGAIYRTIGFNTQWKNDFLSAIGDRMFNNRYFNKRDMYEWLSAYPSIKAHLPYTILYKSLNDIPDMIDRFGTIYIKPVAGLKGRRIVRMSKEKGLVAARYRESRKCQQLTFDSREQICQFIKQRFKRRRYLIQQAIQLMHYEGGIADFRCVLQKNQSEIWEFMAMFGRCGEKGSIVSNISSGGSVFEGDELLKKVISSCKNFCCIREEIRRLALAACASLDALGFNCGVLGLDIGVDEEGRVWLIEINNRDPCMKYALDIGNQDLYCRLKTNPVFYAKALAGFKADVKDDILSGGVYH